MNSLSRKKSARTSLIRNLATSLILFEKITTTTTKAKAIKGVVERLILKTKIDDLTTRRNLEKFLFDRKAVLKVIEVLAPRYTDNKSGIIKSYKIKNRKGDGAELTLLEFKKIEVKDESKNESTNDKKPKTTKVAKSTTSSAKK